MLRPAEVPGPMDTEEPRDVVIGPRVEHAHTPPEGRGRVPKGCDRVPDIVLAVAIGPHSVLPRLAPEDRGKGDHEAPAVEQSGPRVAVATRSLLEHMIVTEIVMHAGRGGRSNQNQANGELRIQQA